MNVEIIRSRHFDGLVHPVGRADRRAPNAQHDAGRKESRCAISVDRRAERLRVERPGTIGRDLDEIPLADPGDSYRLVDGRVGLRRGIDPELFLPGHSGIDPSPAERALAHRQYSAHIGRRGRLLDNPLEPFGQTERLAHPVDHPCLNLRSRGRGLPEHALGRHHRRQVLGDHRNRRGVGAEVGEKAPVLPVRHTVRHNALEVGEDRLHVFRLFRRRRGAASRRSHPARSAPGRTAPLAWPGTPRPTVQRVQPTDSNLLFSWDGMYNSAATSAGLRTPSSAAEPEP